jgi:hypothetical protein
VRVAVLTGRFTVQPRAVGWWKRSWLCKRRLPSKTVAVNIPDNARIIGLDVQPSGVTIRVRIDCWRFDYRHSRCWSSHDGLDSG